jgi:2,3,4,5-tetrahydropyridine-2-carboxylate N-succinyltransferase
VKVAELRSTIEALVDDAAKGGSRLRGPDGAAVDEVIGALDDGTLRVAEPSAGGWVTNAWVKQAILLYFSRMDSMVIGTDGADALALRGAPPSYYDKLPTKRNYRKLGARCVPGGIARYGSYLGKNAILMPGFVNIGAYVDDGSMVDTWATVGSCAQIGKNVHLAGGVGIGGVLEPLQAEPVIIEDNCFIGARSEVVEGVVVETGAVLAMGTFIGATTKIVDRDIGEILMGRVPAYSVVVPGSLPGKNLPDGRPGPSLYCAVIVKKVDEGTRARTSINELLRE